MFNSNLLTRYLSETGKYVILSIRYGHSKGQTIPTLTKTVELRVFVCVCVCHRENKADYNILSDDEKYAEVQQALSQVMRWIILPDLI
jgi:hypothetical protein